MKKRSRREFLAGAAGVGAGVAVGGLLGCFPDVGGKWPEISAACRDDGAIGPVPGASRVVEVYREDAVVAVTDETSGTTKNEINAGVMRPMLEAALQEISGGAEEPWRALLPDCGATTRIGLKVNCLNPLVPTSAPLVKAIVESLKDGLGLDAARLIVWDRRLDELSPSPPRHLYDSDELGATVLGTVTSTSDSSGPGYGEAMCGMVAGKVPRLSRILTDLTDLTINCPVLKTHDISGVTGAMKNIYGVIDNPQDYHTNIATALPALYRLPPIRDSMRLTICDALIAVTRGGTSSPPNVYPKRILVARDPLALDSFALDLVNRLRSESEEPLEEVDPAFTEWLQNGYELGLGTLDYDLVAVEQPVA